MLLKPLARFATPRMPRNLQGDCVTTSELLLPRKGPARHLLIVMLVGVVALNTACMRKTNQVFNDNLYVIRKNNKKQPVSYDAMLASKSSQLSDSINKTLKAQAANTPKKKDSISNADILEKENPEISVLLAQSKNKQASADVYFRLGKIYHDFRIYDEAQRYYQKAIQLEPKNAAYHEYFARLWRDWGAPDLGINSAQQALQLKPDAPEGWNTLGTLYDRMGKRKQAVESYQKALAADPNLDYVYSNLCFTYLQDGDLDRATYYGQQAVRRNPSLIVAHNNLGLAYGMQGNFDQAFDEFKQAGDEAAARNNLGLLLLKKNHISESMEQFKLAARMKPFYRAAAENYYAARSLRFQRGRPKGAKAAGYETFGLEWVPESTGADPNLPLSEVGFLSNALFSEPSVPAAAPAEPARPFHLGALLLGDCGW
jgi:tetratricopeptide (TPR) repeat protein